VAGISGRRGRFSNESPGRRPVSTLSSTAWPALSQAAPEGKSVHSARPVAKTGLKTIHSRLVGPIHFCSRFNIAILERGRSLAPARRGDRLSRALHLLGLDAPGATKRHGVISHLLGRPCRPTRTPVKLDPKDADGL
jgi:hypothetical protein